MSVAPDDHQRQVVPRWRPSTWRESASTLSPLIAAGTAQVQRESSPEWSRAVSGWRTGMSLSTASELVGAALIFGKSNDDDARSAAQFIARMGTEASDPLQSLAGALLSGGHLTLNSGRSDARTEIPKLRSRLASDPRDALAWIDLGFWQAAGGNLAAAHRAVFAAISQSRHRFVLRSAARFYVHVGDFDRALDVLRRSGQKHDPWIAAADVAISSQANVRSAELKSATKLIESGSIAPGDLTELAAALATIELSNGDRRGARKLVERALQAPTENTVAQLVWLNQQDPRLTFRLDQFDHLTPSEARTRDETSRGNFKAALTSAWAWLDDQPFSVGPAASGSFAASSGEDDQEGALKILERGLTANPGHMLLLNNKAYALASLGRVREAEEAISRVSSGQNRGAEITLVATRGLVEYRKGNHQAGRELYDLAIGLFGAGSANKSRALLMHARESFVANAAWAKEIYADAIKTVSTTSPPEIQALKLRVEKLFNSR